MKGSRVPSERTPSIQSLDRGLIILEAVGGCGTPVSRGQLTELLGVDPSSAIRLANTLKRRGFLACPAGRKDYILGPSIWRLSHECDWNKMLVELSHGCLKWLTGETLETSHLAVREGQQALFLDHVTASHVIAVAGQTGDLVPLYCTAHGKALLADFDRSQLTALFGNALLKAYTRRTIVSLGRLAEECAEINTRGFATEDEEYVDGIRCVAAPTRDRDHAIVGSIGISAPLSRFPEECYGSAGQQVAKAAREICELLSSPEPVASY